MEVEQLKNVGLRIISAVSNKYGGETPDGIPLLQDLTKYAETCQSKYGNKKSLATDMDICVLNMCNQWVKVLSHGLKIPLSTYQSLQTLINAGLHFAFNINLLDTCLWNYTKLHLTRHEEDRFTRLKTINSPLGYFRAFLRSALNEKSLERYLQSWLSHDSIAEYYEDWAITINTNNTQILLNAASGLATIFFSLSIDKPELNQSIPVNQTANSIAEPVITLDRSTIKCVINRNVQKQVISFDKVEEKSHINYENIVATGSTSGSRHLKCDNYGITVEGTMSTNLKELSQIENISDQTLSELSNMKMNVLINDKNALSDFGSNSDVSSTSDDKKYPEEEINEVNENDKPFFKLHLSDDESFEVSEGDKSNQLMKQYEQNSFLKLKISHMEDEFRERNNVMEKTIINLTKENKKLKEQLRNYVTAVETLKPGNDAESDEIKHYEEKLVQVAQMHAELMEFNDLLQRQLQTQIDPFGLHYPLTSLSTVPECRVSIWVPSTYLITRGSKSFHIYQVFLKAGVDEWNVYRRYSEFRKLYSELKNSHPDISLFKFPQKKTLGKKEAWLVEQRRGQIQAWLRHIIHSLPQLYQSTSRLDFITLLPFFRDPGNYENSGALRPLPTP